MSQRGMNTSFPNVSLPNMWTLTQRLSAEWRDIVVALLHCGRRCLFVFLCNQRINSSDETDQFGNLTSDLLSSRKVALLLKIVAVNWHFHAHTASEMDTLNHTSLHPIGAASKFPRVTIDFFHKLQDRWFLYSLAARVLKKKIVFVFWSASEMSFFPSKSERCV